MPSPEQLEYAELLLGKAEGDARTCATLAVNDDMADDPVGFHAQQAIEKAIKAVFVLHAVDFPRTHDLEYLIELAGESGIDVPESLRSAEWLTPWAAELRYDEPSGPLNRASARELADSAVAWARRELERVSPGPEDDTPEDQPSPNAS